MKDVIYLFEKRIIQPFNMDIDKPTMMIRFRTNYLIVMTNNEVHLMDDAYTKIHAFSDSPASQVSYLHMDTNYIYIATKDAKLRIYKYKNNDYSLVSTIECQTYVTSIDSSAYKIYTSSGDSNLKVYSLSSFVLEETKFIEGLIFVKNYGAYLYCVTNYTLVNIYRKDNYELFKTINYIINDQTQDSFISSANGMIYVVKPDSLGRVLDLEKLTVTNYNVIKNVNSCLIGRNFLFAKGTNTIVIQNFKNVIKKITHDRDIISIGLDIDERNLIVFDGSKNITLYSLADHESVHIMSKIYDSPESLIRKDYIGNLADCDLAEVTRIESITPVSNNVVKTINKGLTSSNIGFIY